MGNTHHQRYKHTTVSNWRVLKDNGRQLPCHVSIAVRVKYVEPGVQSRWCARCQVWRYFTLEPMAGEKWEGVLRLRWLTDSETAEHEAGLDGDLTLDQIGVES
jgi:hypothetical protein